LFQFSSVTSCLLYGLLIANHLQYVFDYILTDVIFLCRHYLGNVYNLLGSVAKFKNDQKS
ncbi:hypothetical protein ACWKTS_34660, partial [Bacillus toyonensis]